MVVFILLAALELFYYYKFSPFAFIVENFIKIFHNASYMMMLIFLTIFDDYDAWSEWMITIFFVWLCIHIIGLATL